MPPLRSSRSRPPRGSRSPRGVRGRAGASVAGFTLGLLAAVTGFVFAGTGAEPAPTVEARAAAEEAVAVRMAVGAPLLPPAPRAEPPPQRQPLLAGAKQVIVPRHATRVRVASVGIDAEVRPVGLRFAGGTLQYDTPRVEAGQYVGSASPGEAGNTVIGGHVSSRGGEAVFAALRAWWSATPSRSSAASSASPTASRRSASSSRTPPT